MLSGFAQTLPKIPFAGKPCSVLRRPVREALILCGWKHPNPKSSREHKSSGQGPALGEQREGGEAGAGKAELSSEAPSY